MVSGLINANPVVYEKKERRVRSASDYVDEYAVEPIDQQEVFDHVRDIKDPEHPYSLEELKVITEDAIEVNDERSYVRSPSLQQLNIVVWQQLLVYAYESSL